MANLKTLKPFAKGKDPRRNTKGRPKGKVSRLEDLLDKALKEEVTFGNQKITNEVAIVMKLIDEARKGKTSAFKLFMEYRFGKPTHYCPKCDSEVNTRLKREVEIEREKLWKLREKARDVGVVQEVDKWMEEWEELAKK